MDIDPANPQELVDEAVEHKGAEYIRENFEGYFGSVQLLGMEINREDVEIREASDTPKRG